MTVNKERLAFERLMRRYLGAYFQTHIYDLISGRILIEDDGSAITIYNKKSKTFDWKIVY